MEQSLSPLFFLSLVKSEQVFPFIPLPSPSGRAEGIQALLPDTGKWFIPENSTFPGASSLQNQILLLTKVSLHSLCAVLHCRQSQQCSYSHLQLQ